jgi:16S rRNA (guanine966-N2)-methyltransferase
MRITGGEWGGRRLKAPAGLNVRPTQDRVRGALFSMLAAAVPGARVLDLFAGSGAVGIEALSRGAREAVWVEADRRHAAILRQNVAACGAAGTVVADDCLRWLARFAGQPFDLIFADPPYEWAQAHGFAGLAEQVSARGVLRSGGILVTEQPRELPAGAIGGWEMLRDREYGHTRLVIYRLAARAGEPTDGGHGTA